MWWLGVIRIVFLWRRPVAGLGVVRALLLPAALALCNCAEPVEPLVITSGSCPSLPQAAPGQVVSYRITHDLVGAHVYKISQITSNSGGVIYTFQTDGVNETTLDSREFCDDGNGGTRAIGLTSDQMFLLTGSRLRRQAAGFPDGTVSPPPVDYAGAECRAIVTVVKAGEFAVQACTVVSVDGKGAVTSYFRPRSGDGRAAIPLRGLIQYDERDESGSSTVELLDWNGL